MQSTTSTACSHPCRTFQTVGGAALPWQCFDAQRDADQQISPGQGGFGVRRPGLSNPLNGGGQLYVMLRGVHVFGCGPPWLPTQQPPFAASSAGCADVFPVLDAAAEFYCPRCKAEQNGNSAGNDCLQPQRKSTRLMQLDKAYQRLATALGEACLGVFAEG